MSDTSNYWSAEYRHGGIPSSVSAEPSTTLLWALSNWSYLTGNPRPRTALDVGCGTGRNTLHLARLGIHTTGFDFSEEALERAAERLSKLQRPDFQLYRHNLTEGLPVTDKSIDLLCDIFVYKHQIAASERRLYRDEMKRVLAPNGRILLALAEIRDGYYSQCPAFAVQPEQAGIEYVSDTAIQVGSVLFTLDGLTAEMADHFELEMSWLKRREGVMHNKNYLRYTLATIWAPR